MRRLLAVALIVVLAATGGTALGARGDPQERFTRADQARARAMLLRTTDLPGFRASAPADAGSDFYCRALDESDLTVTGKAESPRFTAGVSFVTSTAYLYESVADADASWRRGTSAGGVRCLREGLRRELRGTEIELLSFRKLSFPRVARRSVRYRAVARQQGVRIYLDLVALQHGRAQAAVVLGAGLAAPPLSVEIGLARLVASRMAKALRGA